MNSKRPKSVRYVFALMFSTSTATLLAATPALSQTASEFQQIAAFDNSSYNHCDVTMLARLWGHNHYQSKRRLGQKILWGDEYYIDQFLSTSRSRGIRCEWEDLPLDYSDAEQLAAAWEVSVWDAKVTAVELYSSGDGAMVAESLYAY